MKRKAVKIVTILMYCAALFTMTACSINKTAEEKGSKKSELVVQGDINGYDMDFDTDSTNVVGVVPWYIESEKATKLSIAKRVHLKWSESDLESEVSNYSSNVAGCPKLKEIEVEEGSETLFSHQGMLYKYGKKKEKELYACPVMKDGEVTVPEGVLRIWSCAFNGCGEVTSVSIPKSVRGIGDAAFGNMEKCSEIRVSKDNPYYESEDGVLYTKGKGVLIAYPSGKKAEIFQVPKGVKVIASGAFMCANHLKKVVLPPSVTQLCESSFRQCQKLKVIQAKGDISYLDRFAFYKTPAKRENFPGFSKREADTWKNWRKEVDKNFIQKDSNWIHGYRGLGI
ncbi:MAG: leucine-rich repeat domain-containing protein [Eubacterium sp.]|nr:leucine-rich repeat domain-containing protein [Eubacterium sp.]